MPTSVWPTGVWVVVVARVAHNAKSRLAPVLSSPERRQLALDMLTDVLAALKLTQSRQVLDGVVAVVDDPEAHARAQQLGALVVDDPRWDDMNAAAELGIEAVRQRGAQTAIVLPGDIPQLRPTDLEALIEAAASMPRTVVVGASRDRQGTNALLLRPPEVIRPAFGPPSVERHVRAGLSVGAHARVVFDLGLALDVDTPADLAALRDARRFALAAT